MIIEEIMTTNIISLGEEQTILEAYSLMIQHSIRHLPIVNREQHLLGIVSDRDIRDALPSILININHQDDVLQLPIKNIMKTDLITGHPLDFVEEIGAIFYKQKINCLPIVKNRKLVGIITHSDLLHSLIELTGAHQPGSQIEIKAENQAGVLHKITKVFHDRKAKILSILMYPDKKDEKFNVIVIRVQTINPTSMIEDLKNAGYEVLWPNLPGINR